jgi:hypothetical protein
MSRKSSPRWLVFSFAFIFLSVLLLVSERAPAQNSEQTSQRASISMEQEHHHHLEFENSYVRVFFVEIPAHESTLFHRHDFPYLSVPPTGADAAMPPSPGPAGQETGLPIVGYSPGNFSHAVSNSRDFALRNVAIELLRPQGTVRNRCAQVVRDQPKEGCDILEANTATPATRTPLFETDELLVEAWHITGHVTTPPWDDPADVLLASLSGVSVAASGGINTANALKGGLLWVPAGSNPVFKTAQASDGQFIAITFKDSSPPSGPRSF